MAQRDTSMEDVKHCQGWIDGASRQCPNRVTPPSAYCTECEAGGSGALSGPCIGCQGCDTYEPNTTTECDRKIGQQAFRCKVCFWVVIVDSHGQLLCNLGARV